MCRHRSAYAAGYWWACSSTETTTGIEDEDVDSTSSDDNLRSDEKIYGTVNTSVLGVHRRLVKKEV